MRRVPKAIKVLNTTISDPQAIQPGITGCILARNEEQRLEPALDSLRWTDQLILIDHGSTDRTVEIARRYAHLVLKAPAGGLQRNLAIPHAEGDWILFLDADERWPEALVPIVRDLVVRHGDAFVAMRFPYKHHFAGRGSGTGCGAPAGAWWSHRFHRLVKMGRGETNPQMAQMEKMGREQRERTAEGCPQMKQPYGPNEMDADIGTGGHGTAQIGAVGTAGSCGSRPEKPSRRSLASCSLPCPNPMPHRRTSVPTCGLALQSWRTGVGAHSWRVGGRIRWFGLHPGGPDLDGGVEWAK